MSVRTRNGWQAEAFVQRILTERHPGCEVVPLAPSFPADLLVLPDYTPYQFYEVKSSRNRAQALRTKLTAPEAAFRARMVGRHVIARVQTFPGGACELLREE